MNPPITTAGMPAAMIVFSAATPSRPSAILEDEDLAISIHAKQDYSTEHDDLGTPYRVFTPGEEWGSFPAAGENDWNHAVWCQYFSIHRMFTGWSARIPGLPTSASCGCQNSRFSQVGWKGGVAFHWEEGVFPDDCAASLLGSNLQVRRKDCFTLFAMTSPEDVGFRMVQWPKHSVTPAHPQPNVLWQTKPGGNHGKTETQKKQGTAGHPGIDRHYSPVPAGAVCPALDQQHHPIQKGLQLPPAGADPRSAQP